MDVEECNFHPIYHNPLIVGAAMTTGHKRYCDLINPKHPDYDPYFAKEYYSMSLYLMKPITTTEELETRNAKAEKDIKAKVDKANEKMIARQKEPKGIGKETEEKENGPPGKKPRSKVQLDMLRLKTVRECPDFVKRSDCGCGVNQCLRGYGKDGLVSLNQCVECVKSRFPELA